MRAIVACVLMGVACTGDTGPGVSSPSSPAPAVSSPSTSPRRGGTIRLGVVGAPVTLDPYSPVASDLTHLIDRGLYRSLYRFDPSGRPVPDLARRIEPTRHGVHVFLRRALWSDGSEVVAHDVLLSIKRAAPPSGFARVTRAHAISAHVVALKGGVGNWPRALATLSFVAPNGGPGRGHRPFVGAGPFRIASYVPGLHVVFERNPHASVAQRPFLRRVIVEFVDSEGVLLELLRRGRIDAAVPPSSVNLADRLDDMGLEYARTLGWESIRLELERSLSLADRSAVVAAIDRAELVDGLVRDDGRAATTLHPGPGSVAGAWADVGEKGRVDAPVKLATDPGDELLGLLQRALQVQLVEAHVRVEPIGASSEELYGAWRVADPADVSILRVAGGPGLVDGQAALRNLTAWPLAEVKTYLAWRPGIHGLAVNSTFEGPLWNMQTWWRSG